MRTSKNTEFLFVYGTLMKSYAGNPFSKEIEKFACYHATAFTTGELYLIDVYPGLIKTEKFEFVYGELFIVNNSKKLFSILDSYEDYNPSNKPNSLYVRDIIHVYKDVNTKPVKAWTYIYNQPYEAFRRIESGNFIDF